MIGRLRTVVIDCPEPDALARFYGELLGMSRRDSESDGNWVTISDGNTDVAFQRAPDLREPRWPDPERPQQFHLDVTVEDVDAAEAKVLALGATRLPGAGDNFRVYADPAGHPFCLCWDL